MKHCTMLIYFSLLSSSLFALRIPVNIKEFHQVSRNGEPVKVGVPLPKGAYKSTLYFQVEGVSNQQFHVTMLWPDSSIRWMLCQFNSDVDAGGNSTYYITDKGTGTSSSQLVTEDKDYITVSTLPWSFL